MLAQHTVRFILISLLTATVLGAVSQPRYKVKIDRTVRPVMRDGIELGAVVVRPDAEGQFPAIMNYTPYRTLSHVKSSYDEEKYSNTTHGPSYFAERGYAVVYYDVRGTGNSGGSSQDIYSEKEQNDAYDMVEWIAAQPWCDGGVGMWGYSYGGVVQWQVGIKNPPHLKTLVVGSSNDDVYLDWVYPGGSLRPYMFDTYSPLMAAFNFAPPDIDLVGQKWTEIWEERLANNRPWGIGYITHPVHGSYWTDRSLQPDYSRVKVPTLLWSGWADVYPTPILRAFANLEVPKKVLVGPWGHWWPEMAVPGPRIDGRHELLKWYDHWLKGMDTGVMDEPPVTLFVKEYKEPEPAMYIDDNGFWRFENEWPPARNENTPMYLHADGLLSEDSSASAPEETDQYTYDPTVGATSGIYWGGGVLPWGMAIDQRTDEALSLTYTTPPLEEDVEAIGEPIAVLYVSSSATSAYFHVKLTDVAPDGTSKWIADEGLLASHRNSHAVPEPLEPGEIYELRIPLKFVAYVFPKGHRIRVDIASADFQNAWPVAEKAVNKIHRGGRNPSYVVLPITPTQDPKLPTPEFKPSPRPAPKLQDLNTVKHEITRDLVSDTVTVHLMAQRNGKSDDGRRQTGRYISSNYTVSKANPAEASMRAGCRLTLNGPEGEIIVESSETLVSDITSFRFLTQVEVTVQGKPHFNKSWRVSVPRRLN